MVTLTWRIEDDCLAPQARISIDYAGKDPFRAYKILRDTLRKVLEVESKDLWERDFRWDISSDPRGFFVRVYVDKGIDARSKALIEVIMQGEIPSDPNKEGRITIQLGGRLRTEYKRETGFQQLPIYKGLLWLYHKIFYNRVRRGYLGMCYQWIQKLNSALREALEISEEALGKT
ncbi:MAG: hypothetical protein QXX07_01510 [Candidatus Aenigmatarchaeota archaeon]